MRGGYTQSLVSRGGHLESHLRTLPPTLGKAQFCFLQPSACSYPRGHPDAHHTVRGLPNGRFSAARPLGNFDVCRPAYQPKLELTYIFLTLIAVIHNHLSGRGKACRALEDQAGCSRGFSFQCVLLASWGVMQMASVALWSKRSLLALGTLMTY